jgi:hypothetical protein
MDLMDAIYQLDTCVELVEARLLVLLSELSGDWAAVPVGELERLDFMVHWPVHLERALQSAGWSEEDARELVGTHAHERDSIGARLAHVTSDWTARHFQAVGRLVSRGLVVMYAGTTGLEAEVALQEGGHRVGRELAEAPEYADIVQRSRAVGELLLARGEAREGDW